MVKLHWLNSAYVLAFVAGGLAGAQAAAPPGGTSGNGCMCETTIRDLHASRPAAGIEEQLSLFGQFVGDWNIRTEWYAEDGSVKKRANGHIHAGWILYGYALQDIWSGNDVNDPADAPPSGFGTTLRFYDPKAGLWRVVWTAPKQNIIQTLTGRKIGNEIVLESIRPDGKIERWIFFNIKPDSFDWRAVESSGSGKTWRLLERVWANRQK